MIVMETGQLVELLTAGIVCKMVNWFEGTLIWILYQGTIPVAGKFRMFKTI